MNSLQWSFWCIIRYFSHWSIIQWAVLCAHDIVSAPRKNFSGKKRAKNAQKRPMETTFWCYGLGFISKVQLIWIPEVGFKPLTSQSVKSAAIPQNHHLLVRSRFTTIQIYKSINFFANSSDFIYTFWSSFTSWNHSQEKVS